MEGSGGVRVTFWGVRGSTPCEGEQYRRYGGHSSCVALEAAGHLPVVFDLGTGLTPYGDHLGGAAAGFHGSVLLTHLHWDHVQGLPFFTPLHNRSSLVDIYGPRQPDGTLHDVFAGLMRPPYFPIRPSDLQAELRWQGIGSDDFAVGDGTKVRSRSVRHVGDTLGYRVEIDGVSVVYISDHGQGCGDHAHDDYIPQDVLELCDAADLIIHDAQHTDEEFEQKRAWGHCTVDYALHVAREAGAKSLALFHHCPSHGDDVIDTILVEARDAAARMTNGPEVIAAAEGLVVDLTATGGLR